MDTKLSLLIDNVDAMVALMNKREELFFERIEYLKRKDKLGAERVWAKYQKYGRVLTILAKKNVSTRSN